MGRVLRLTICFCLFLIGGTLYLLSGSTALAQGKGKRPPRSVKEGPPSPPTAPEAVLPDVDVFNSDYVGDLLSVDLDAAPLFQFLEFFSEQFGFSFILDRSVKEVEPISVRARRLPWNLLVKSVLQARGLVVQREGGLYRILSQEARAAEEEV